MAKHITNNTYIDTRGNTTQELHFTDVILKGIAEGGGLFVPKELPAFDLDEILSLATMNYAQRAAFIYKRFGLDLTDVAIDNIAAHAYGENFDTPEIAPIANVAECMNVLELWHGPTSAFKDMALQCMPLFFSASAETEETPHNYLILVATSGDTGKAALEGFKNRAHTSIIVFFPQDGVSDIQRKQMVTQRGENVCVYGAHGNFDDCQTSVKATFAHEAFNAELKTDKQTYLSSANSINWGRLMPQIVYYMSSYALMVESGEVAPGAPIDVCVPTGNFGNILGAYYAREMGTPIERLICASNENCILTDFINTGTYDISNRPFVLTPSPSMDILVSSNLERQLFELANRDAEKIQAWMNDLKTKKCFRVDSETFKKLRKLYAADCVSNDDCLSTIKQVWEENSYLLDPHTAVAWTVAERLKSENPVLIVSTAHWAKFGNNVYRALNEISAGSSLPQEIEALSGVELNKHILASLQAQDAEATRAAGLYIPKGLSELDALEPRFKDTVEGSREGIEQAVRAFLDR